MVDRIGGLRRNECAKHGGSSRGFILAMTALLNNGIPVCRRTTVLLFVSWSEEPINLVTGLRAVDKEGVASVEGRKVILLITKFFYFFSLVVGLQNITQE